MSEEPQDPVKRRLRITILVWVVLLLAVALAIAWLGDFGVAYESPTYEVVDTIGEVEIRQYAPYLVAETRVDGSLENAGNQGFRILAKYIFGDNRAKQKIAMTAPVSQEKAEGARIAMTAPVTQKRVGEQFKIQFMMPSKYARETLPEPIDSRIEIREVPGRQLAAIRYSGRWSKSKYEENLSKLVEALASKGYEPVGEPIWARYDPPFKPWFMRRNEILTAFAES